MVLNVALISLGCSKNLVDSEVMLNIISKNNYRITDDASKADIIIVNTCGFIESAKQESIDFIIEMGQYKEHGSCKILIASGCLAERYKDELLNEMPELDAVIGTGDYKNILEVIDAALAGNRTLKFGNQENIDIDVLPRIISTLGASAYLKIAEGCDNRCTFCIIPKLRGRYRSRHIEDIVREAEYLAANGIKEINVIAQDITRYGKDLYGEIRLPELLNKLAAIEKIEWIRLLYSYPDEFSTELIETISKQDKICKYLDIPIQHANNGLLKRMARKITKEEIKALINKLREKLPDITLRTSLIVGFPGETESDFQELLDFVKEIRFDRLGAFIYSREEDTPAYDMPNQIDEETKLKRQETVMLAQQQISLENNLKSVGKVLRVLIEGIEDGIYYGRSCKDAPEIDGMVYFTSDKSLQPGDFCNVLIKKAEEYDLVGEVIV